MASRFSFYSFPGNEVLISTITFFHINNLYIMLLISVIVFSLLKCHNCWYQEFIFYYFWYQ